MLNIVGIMSIATYPPDSLGDFIITWGSILLMVYMDGGLLYCYLKDRFTQKNGSIKKEEEKQPFTEAEFFDIMWRERHSWGDAIGIGIVLILMAGVPLLFVVIAAR